MSRLDMHNASTPRAPGTENEVRWRNTAGGNSQVYIITSTRGRAGDAAALNSRESLGNNAHHGRCCSLHVHERHMFHRNSLVAQAKWHRSKKATGRTT